MLRFLGGVSRPIRSRGHQRHPFRSCLPTQVGWGGCRPSLLFRRRISSFGEIPRIPERVVESLTAAGITKPTPIQGQSLKAIMSRRTCYICAPTGTGKTLSFVAPIFGMISRHLKNPPTKGRRPLVLILAPSEALCMQLHADIQLTWGASPETVWEDEDLQPPYLRGGRLSYCLLTEDTSSLPESPSTRPFQEEMNPENAPAILVATPRALLQELQKWKETWASEGRRALDPGQELASPGSGSPVSSTEENCEATGGIRDDALCLSECPPIADAFSMVEHVVVDEADECLDPPGKYAGRKAKQSHARKPPPAAILLTMLKRIRASAGYQLICTSATLNSRVRQMVARHKWGRGPFGSTQIIQRSAPLTLPAGLSHFYHIYSDFLPLLPNPFYELPATSTREPLSEEDLPLTPRIQSLLDAFAEVWRVRLPELRSCLLVTRSIPIPLILEALEKLAETSIPRLPGRSSASGDDGSSYLPRARIIALDSKAKLYEVQRDRVSRKLQAEHQVSGTTPVPSASDDAPEEELERPEIGASDSSSFSSATTPIDLYICNWKQVRGLDLTHISDVFLLDVPKTPQEYIHMAGRTARGRFAAGRVFTLVHRADKKKLLQLYDKVQGYQDLPEKQLTSMEIEQLRAEFGGHRWSFPRSAPEAVGDSDVVEESLDTPPQMKLSKKQRKQRKHQALTAQRRERLRVEEEELLSKLTPQAMKMREIVRDAVRRRLGKASKHWLAEAAIPGDRERLDHDTIPREKVDEALRLQELAMRSRTER